MCIVFYVLPISFVAQLVERTAHRAGVPGPLSFSELEALIYVHGILPTAN